MPQILIRFILYNIIYIIDIIYVYLLIEFYYINLNINHLLIYKK